MKLIKIILFILLTFLFINVSHATKGDILYAKTNNVKVNSKPFNDTGNILTYLKA
jgi:hypothetical protein